MASYFPPGAVSNQVSVRTPSPANSPLSPPNQRSNALSNRLTSVLSASYADSDIRDALETLSLRGVHNTAEFRRQLRLDVQKEVVDSNAGIVRDFGKVAEVRFVAEPMPEIIKQRHTLIPVYLAAIETYRNCYLKPEPNM